MSAMLGLAIFSTAVSAYGKYKSGKAQAESMRDQAELNKLKAEEIIARDRINRETLFTEAGKVLGLQATQVAGSGLSQDASSMQLLEQTMNMAVKNAKNKAREASWNASMAIRTGNAQESSADSTEDATNISALGTLGMGTVNAYNNSPKGS